MAGEKGFFEPSVCGVRATLPVNGNVQLVLYNGVLITGQVCCAYRVICMGRMTSGLGPWLCC